MNNNNNFKSCLYHILKKDAGISTELADEIVEDKTDILVRSFIKDIVGDSVIFLDELNGTDPDGGVVGELGEPGTYIDIDQKSEPKFKVGDWVIDQMGNVNCVKEVDTSDNTSYGCTLDNHVYFSGSCANGYCLWTIDDAKPGDILVAHECLVIFKQIDGLNIRCYCTYHFMNNPMFFVNTLQNKDAFKPATKEQRELLFAKMKESGYEWDAEKKELRKIEQKLTDEIEPKFKVGDKITLVNVPKYPAKEIIAIQNDAYYFDMFEHLPFSHQDEWKLVDQNPVWSEEDEHRAKDAIYFLETAKKHYAGTTELDACIIWLKYLKDRYAWKPSDDQMEALLYEVNAWDEDSVNGQNLKSLYQDLKKLKGE